MQMAMLEIVSLELARFWSKKKYYLLSKSLDRPFKFFLSDCNSTTSFKALKLVVLSNELNAIFLQIRLQIVGFWEGGEKIFEHGFTNIAASWQHSKKIEFRIIQSTKMCLQKMINTQNQLMKHLNHH